MADTYYVWSPIHYHDGDQHAVIKLGETVTQDQVGVDDETWEQWLEGGSVRTTKYPAKVTEGMSPNEHRLMLLRRRREELEAEIAGVGGVPGDTTPSETTDSSSSGVNS